MSGTWRATWKYVGPLTVVWAGVCATIGALLEGWIDWRWSIAYVALMLLAVGVLFVFREVTTIHHLTNSHNDEQNARIEQLTRALRAGGEPVPDAPPTGAAS